MSLDIGSVNQKAIVLLTCQKLHTCLSDLGHSHCGLPLFMLQFEYASWLLRPVYPLFTVAQRLDWKKRIVLEKTSTLWPLIGLAVSFPWKMDHIQVKLRSRHECPKWQTFWMTQIIQAIRLTSLETSNDHMKGGLGSSMIPEGVVSPQTHTQMDLGFVTVPPIHSELRLWWVLDIYSSWYKQLCELASPQGVVFYDTV